MSGKKRNFVVIGLGMFGRTIATQLVSFGNHVLGIDSDEVRVNDVIDEISEAVIADVRDDESLREAGVDQYDVAVIAIGDDLESNVLCTMNVKLLGVETIWAKAMNPTHHRILDRLGADRVIHPEEEIGQHVAQMLHNPLVRDYLSLGDGNYLVDLSIPETFEGKRLEELKQFTFFTWSFYFLPFIQIPSLERSCLNHFHPYVIQALCMYHHFQH